MKKFACECGRNVRDVYYKNGEYKCVKCFWEGCESPFDYIINMLAAKGLVITYAGEPVLILKQFSADCLDDKEAVVRPDSSWTVLEGDDFWANYNGEIDQLRSYVTCYSVKKDEACERRED